MERHHNLLFVGFPHVHIRRVIRSEAPQVSAPQRRMLRSHLQQGAHILVQPLLLLRPSILLKRILRILCPPPGKIPAIVRIAPARHTDFIAVIHFRDATHGEKQSKRQLQPSRCSPRGSRKARRIVIPEKWHQKLRMRVQRVLPQDIRQFSNRRTFQQNVAQREEKREIKRRRQLRINRVPAFSPALVKRGHRWIGMKHFADC